MTATTRQPRNKLARLDKAIAVLSETTNPLAMPGAIFEILRGPLSLDVFFNYLVLDGPSHMWLSSYAGIPLEAAREIQHLEFGHAVCGTVALTRTPMTVNDVQNFGGEKAQLVRSYGVKVYSCHPLIADGRLMGTLSVGSKSRERFSELELLLLERVALRVARAMAALLPPRMEPDAVPPAPPDSTLRQGTPAGRSGR